MSAIDAALERRVIDPDAFADLGYPHAEWRRLRAEAPVHYIDQRGIHPFWAITRHADIVAISRDPSLWINAPRIAVAGDAESQDADPGQRNLLFMDPPEHRAYRAITSHWFTPRSVAKLLPEIDRICAELLNEIPREGEVDFVARIASYMPLAVICRILGTPRDDWPQLFEWTNQSLGSSDPEYRQDAESQAETRNRATAAMFEYFMKLVEQRRAAPRDDIVSLVATAELDGTPLPPFELLSYCLLLVVAGNETTRNATSGGLLALLENPQELARLRARPAELLQPAVEEIVRWTSPVVQFCRTATRDVELHGQRIREGESVALFYPSANRDDAVFDEPDRFRVDRKRNPHLGFGVGEHFCLGANLARLELRAIFRALLQRLEAVELTGPPQRLRSNFIGGIKHLPVHYRLN